MEFLPLIIIGVFFLLGSLSVEVETFWWTAVCAIATFVALGSYLGFNPAVYAWEHKLDILKHLIGYIGIGIVWSFVRWVLHLRRFRSLFRNLKAEYEKHPKTDPNEPFIPSNWTWKLVWESANLPDRYIVDLRGLRIPRASNHKARITAWASYWPYSMMGYFGNLFFHDIIIAIFDSLRWAYERASKWMFRNDPDLS